MRPRGEERKALSKAAWDLAVERAKQGANWREISARAQVGFTVGKRTVENMARAGELQPVGTARVASARRPMVLYVPAGSCEPASPALDTLMRSWLQPA